MTLRSSNERLSARDDEPLVFPGRKRRAAQDWKRLPVVGISSDDAEDYAAWISRTGRVPGFSGGL